ncbi:MAG: TIGR03915 family putative DNA repair protein [Gemmatimonas sp.]
MRIVTIEPHFASWREAARGLIAGDVTPDRVSWHESSDQQSSLLTLLGETFTASPAESRAHKVPSKFIDLAESVVCYASIERWDALYRVLYRITHGEPSLLEVHTDPDVNRLHLMNRAVRRATHKMHAFVRFRAVECESDEGALTLSGNAIARRRYVAWFEPSHHVVQRAAPLFVRRFPSMRWSILTSLECAHWDGTEVRFTEGIPADNYSGEDELEELWRSYYANIFNPARVATATMQAEMPRMYWSNLPEARLIPSLTRDAPGRVLRMLSQLDEAPLEIPSDLASVVGDVTEPRRVSVASFPSVRTPDDLEIAGAWDPEHDPGVTEAAHRVRRERDEHRAESIALEGAEIRVGTASWTDPTLLRCGQFYPSHINTPDARLRFYASRFSLVEVDATYYAMPSRSMAAAWAQRTPDNFVFDIKAFALMTQHMAEVNRLPDWLRRKLPPSVQRNRLVSANDLPTSLVDDVWQRFVEALNPLEDAGKLGAILLQFPRWFTPSRESADVLRAARSRLGNATAVVEFRNPAWVEGRIASRTLSLLEQLQLGYVIVDAPPGTASSMPSLVAATTDLSVIRLHGRRTATWEARNNVVSERYRYLYDERELSAWVPKVAEASLLVGKRTIDFPDMAKAKQGVHVVFNNCHANYGTSNADEITALLIEFDKERRRAPVNQTRD